MKPDREQPRPNARGGRRRVRLGGTAGVPGRAAGRTQAGDAVAPSVFLVWQLVDSAFPAGGFAHSGGLEAAWQWGEVRSVAALESYVEASLDQLLHAVLPLVAESHAAGEVASRVETVDRHADAWLSNHVANRASRAQGRAFLAASSRLAIGPGMVLPSPPLSHLPVVFGQVLFRLGFDWPTTVRLFLFHHLRGLLAAAVRLNVVGPLQAQTLQFGWARRLETLAAGAETLTLDDLAQTAPVLDLWQGTQDRLYSRLFQS